MKAQTCCFTGHRHIPKTEYERIYKVLFDEITILVKKGITRFRCGGALGFDTAAALVVLDVRKLHPEISLIMDIPCENQKKFWSEEDKLTYDYILAVADEVNVLSDHYHRGCMQRRNRYMVDHSSYIIAYQTEKIGGSAYTVNYARSLGLRVITL